MGYSRHLLSRRCDPLRTVPGSSRRQEIRWHDCLKDGCSTRLCWLAALLLGAAVRGPLRNAPGFVTKLFRLAAGESHRNMTRGATVGVKQSAPNPTEAERNVPAERFSDVGGADDAKEQIR